VKLDRGEEVEAITYIAQPGKVKSDLRPSKKCLSHLLRGCDLLSQESYEKLRRTSMFLVDDYMTTILRDFSVRSQRAYK